MSDIKNRRVLIIDDNRAIHDDFRKILASSSTVSASLAEVEAALFDEAPVAEAPQSFELDSAYQGQEGLERVQQALAAQRPYAMAYVDVRMPPGWDGIETTAQIWKFDPDLQIVICTAHSDYSWGEMIARLGISDRLVILKKPFDNVEVIQLTQALTHKWQLGQQTKQKLGNLETIVQERTVELMAANQTLLAEIAAHTKSERARQMMELQLLQYHKLESIGQLAAGIAHEINTPAQYVGDNTRFVKDSFEPLIRVLRCDEEMITAVKQNAVTPELLARHEEILAASDLDYLCEQIPAALKQTLEGVERVSKIVRAMKDFSHPGGTEKVATDLNRAIESTITVAGNEWKYVAEVKLQLDAGLPLVPCFPGEFNQIILNLVVNAAHAIGDVVGKNPDTKGLITVQTGCIGDQVEVRVTDTGTGIPEANCRKIFEPFFTTKDVGRGTGQGLAMIYGSIVNRHQGTVTFETEVGRGTTFVVRLPLNPAAAGETGVSSLRGIPVA